MSEPKVTVDEKKKTITIVLPLLDKPGLSKSEKNFTVATTRGNLKTDAKYKGKPVTIGVNAYYPNN